MRTVDASVAVGSHPGACVGSAGRRAARALVLATSLTLVTLLGACASGERRVPGGAQPLASLDVAGYLGTWHEVAHYPNWFQRRCVGDTTAEYREAGKDRISVRNRCRTASGFDQVLGEARPRNATLRDGRLMPASLSVTFLPTWIRWLPVGWGRYDVVRLAEHGSFAIVSEPSQEYLWVLARSPRIDDRTWDDIASWLQRNGFDLSRVVRTPAN